MVGIVVMVLEFSGIRPLRLTCGLLGHLKSLRTLSALAPSEFGGPGWLAGIETCHDHKNAVKEPKIKKLEVVGVV